MHEGGVAHRKPLGCTVILSVHILRWVAQYFHQLLIKLSVIVISCRGMNRVEIILAFVILDLNVTLGSGIWQLCNMNKIGNLSEALFSSPVNSTLLHLTSIMVSYKVKKILETTRHCYFFSFANFYLLNFIV